MSNFYRNRQKIWDITNWSSWTKFWSFFKWTILLWVAPYASLSTNLNDWDNRFMSGGWVALYWWEMYVASWYWENFSSGGWSAILISKIDVSGNCSLLNHTAKFTTGGAGGLNTCYINWNIISYNFWNWAQFHYDYDILTNTFTWPLWWYITTWVYMNSFVNNWLTYTWWTVVVNRDFSIQSASVPYTTYPIWAVLIIS